MSKDYAKNVFNHDRKAARKKQKSDLVWVIALLIVLATIIGLFVWRTQAQGQDAIIAKENLTSWTESIKSLFKHNSTVMAKKEMTGDGLAANQDQGVRFDFYTDLPNMKVGALVKEDVAAEAASAQSDNNLTQSVESATKDATTVKKYYLQLGAFKQQSEASQFRLSLLLAGIDADIVKVANMYQVQQGPFASTIQAKAAQHRIEKKGFPGEVKKID